MPALRIGLTGGIAAGKSTVASHLVRRGAILIDYDVLAREVVAPGSQGLEYIVERFGPKVLTASGDLDRGALAALVFSDPQARADLNDITHPLIRQRARDLDAAAPPDTITVHDVPLLAESSMAGFFDVIITVEADEETRLGRLMTTRGMTREDALARIRAQASDAQRRAIATYVIDSTLPRDAMLTAVDELWRELSPQSRYDDRRGEYSRDR
ncbi:dephospho-CoA kinase [Bowdeniella nasicola]|uniref:Dephospho-CoA kinase n=1 Tax=Bowdeniella nasicola TaxID=208480 RepID=A0A1H4AVM9_9ACTO|nr:dephospho-CoA kinase [Bowdeniella nasicola]SEA39924.1 dephospho-CoA kinase [Bowdeniella nasicola]